MEIIKNQTMIQRQSETIIKSELSNTAMVLQTPTVLVEYFSVNSDMTVTSPGFKNIEEYIGPNSTVVYDYIDNLPMSGIDNLVVQSSFDDEVGWDEDYQSEGIIYPNTILPKPYDCFIVKNSKVPALYVVTNISPVTVRSNPFTGISFRLFSRDRAVISQLRKQVHDNYVTTITAIGADKSLVIKQDSYFDIQHHIEQYIDVAEMYKTMFYQTQQTAFVIDGLFDIESQAKRVIVDMTLWKLMFDYSIIIYDDIITYANNNLNTNFEHIFTGCPDIYQDEHVFNKSIISRILRRDKKHYFAEYRFPQLYEPSERITKYQGKNLMYLESYGNIPVCNPYVREYYIWDNEFIDRIANNHPYEEIDLDSAYCTGCNCFCEGKDPQPFNPYLRNVIINWFNNNPINWDAVQLNDERNVENYTLIPIVLVIYKNFIRDLQK